MVLNLDILSVVPSAYSFQPALRATIIALRHRMKSKLSSSVHCISSPQTARQIADLTMWKNETKLHYINATLHTSGR